VTTATPAEWRSTTWTASNSTPAQPTYIATATVKESGRRTCDFWSTIAPRQGDVGPPRAIADCDVGPGTRISLLLPERDASCSITLANVNINFERPVGAGRRCRNRPKPCAPRPSPSAPSRRFRGSTRPPGRTGRASALHDCSRRSGATRRCTCR
jgi:hypothetical protein